MQRRDILPMLTSAGIIAWNNCLASAEAVAQSANVADRDPLSIATADLLSANSILAHEGVIDALGHVSCRHPVRRDHFILSRARPPALVVAADLMEFDADGTPVDAAGRHPYLERYIHAAIYAARPDIQSVVHDHSAEILPFSVSSTALRPISHTAGLLGEAVPVWDIQDKFGAKTNLLVANMAIGADLSKRLGSGYALLMRGHGAVAAGVSVRVATFIAVTLNIQARLLREALALGDVKYLSRDEIAATAGLFDPANPGDAIGRTWEYWCARAGVPFTALAK